MFFGMEEPNILDNATKAIMSPKKVWEIIVDSHFFSSAKPTSLIHFNDSKVNSTIVKAWEEPIMKRLLTNRCRRFDILGCRKVRWMYPRVFNPNPNKVTARRRKKKMKYSSAGSESSLFASSVMVVCLLRLSSSRLTSTPPNVKQGNMVEATKCAFSKVTCLFEASRGRENSRTTKVRE